MKVLPIASLALVLALSGCSSSPSIEEQTNSPSIEEQTKLVEYEKCLENASERLNLIYGIGDNFPKGGDTVGEQLKYSVLQFTLFQDACYQFRPNPRVSDSKKSN